MRRFRILLIILAVALVPRLWLFALNLNEPQRWFTPDSIGYEQLGRNLLRHGVFSQSPIEPFSLDFERTPIYPLFIAGVYAIGGERPALVILLQILLSAGSCCMLYRIARLDLGRRAAFAAAVAQALSLSSIVACQYLLTETLFSAMLTLQLWLALMYRKRGGVGKLAMASILLGVMTLCRPISLLWIAPQIFLLLCETRLPWRGRLTRAGLGIALFSLTLFPWALRNRIHDGAWFLTTNTGYTLYLHNTAAFEAKRTGESAALLRERWIAESEAEFAGHPERYQSAHSRNAWRVERARERIREAPLLYARLHLQPYILLPNITSFFELIGQTESHRGTLDVLNREGLAAATRHYFGNRLWLIGLVVPWMALLGLIYLGAAFGLARHAARRDGIALLLFAAFAMYYLLLPGPVTLPRYREPAMPMLILTAAQGLEWMVRYWRQTRLKSRINSLE